MPLVKQSRLSVSPVSKAEWELILKWVKLKFKNLFFIFMDKI